MAEDVIFSSPKTQIRRRWKDIFFAILKVVSRSYFMGNRWCTTPKASRFTILVRLEVTRFWTFVSYSKLKSPRLKVASLLNCDLFLLHRERSKVLPVLGVLLRSRLHYASLFRNSQHFPISDPSFSSLAFSCSSSSISINIYKQRVNTFFVHRDIVALYLETFPSAILLESCRYSSKVLLKGDTSSRFIIFEYLEKL